MFRYTLAALAALVVDTASLIPDDADARGSWRWRLSGRWRRLPWRRCRCSRGPGAALSQCAAAEQPAAIAATAIAATGTGGGRGTGGGSARRLSVQLRRGAIARGGCGDHAYGSGFARIFRSLAPTIIIPTSRTTNPYRGGQPEA